MHAGEHRVGRGFAEEFIARGVEICIRDAAGILELEIEPGGIASSSTGGGCSSTSLPSRLLAKCCITRKAMACTPWLARGAVAPGFHQQHHEALVLRLGRRWKTRPR